MDREGFFKRLRRSAYGVVHRGDRFTCPFCSRSFNRFLDGGSRIGDLAQVQPIGIGRRPNARCPHCGSNDRARLLYLYLRTTDCFRGRPLKVLEMSPDRHVAAMLRAQSSIAYTCGALEPEEFSDLGAEAVDVTAIPFENESFDVVLCSHILQEVPDDQRGMREIARVLRRTGWGIVQVPLSERLESTIEDLADADPARRRSRFGCSRHVRLYGRDYARRLAANNLIATPTHPTRDGWCLDAERYAVIPDESLFVVRPAA